MKKQFIGILVLAAIAASLAFNIPQNEAVCADHGAAAAGMPVPPASPIPRPADAKVYIVSPKDGDTVEGVKINGAQPFANFQSRIEGLLAK